MVCCSRAVRLPRVPDLETEETRWSFDFDSSSHIVREGDDRFNLYCQAEKSRFEGALARVVVSGRRPS